MITVLSAIVLLLLAGAAVFLLRKPGAGAPRAEAPPPRPAERPPAAPASVASAARPPAAAAPAASGAMPGVTIFPPTELAGFTLLRHDDLPPERSAALVAELGRIPRPPVSLHKLVSPGFLDHASSAELSELIMGEALIAAKVLATVNSPLYGLRQPVLSIGQAMIFLGLNTVRSICLRYLLDDSFKASSPALRQRYDAILKASAIAAELGTRLSLKLELPAPGALVTQIVLCYLGQFATASLLHQQGNYNAAPAGLLQRAQDEQHWLGLAAAEVGGLLMQAWGLPAGIVDDVRDIDRLLVARPDPRDPQRCLRLALCYLCSRLGDRLASGDLGDLAAFDPATGAGADLFHLQASLTAAQLARLTESLHAPELLHAVQQLTGNTLQRA